jgi:hypothetical protein
MVWEGAGAADRKEGKERMKTEKKRTGAAKNFARKGSGLSEAEANIIDIQ